MTYSISVGKREALAQEHDIKPSGLVEPTRTRSWRKTGILVTACFAFFATIHLLQLIPVVSETIPTVQSLAKAVSQENEIESSFQWYTVSRYRHNRGM